MLTCPGCGFENADNAKFCSQCATALGAAAAAPREERKVVTVVFADLVGSTARAERLDPEDVRKILAPYHDRLRHELERHGGTVEKFIGDAVVGVFGAPVAHEDDAERAVRAALAIQEAIAELNQTDSQLELEVRVGVHTGEALVSVGARPELGEAMVAGDVINTGARIQAAAPPGGIFVGEQTFWATERAIEYHEADPVTAKGKAAPIAVWQALQARSRFGIDLAPAGGAKLIGRERELDLLAGALARVRADRTTELVTLVGVPGIGKSRLVSEMFGIVGRDPDIIYWRQGRCLPYGDGVTFWALGEMAKAHAGIFESDSSADAEEKLSRTVAGLLPNEREASWVAAHLRPLVGLVTEADASAESRHEAFAAWRRFFEAVAEERPLVLVFEDLHWADEGLLDFVDGLADRVSGVPLLVLCSARPELLERRPGWGGGKRNTATVSLMPLTEDETASLLAALLDRPLLLAETQAALLQRAGGNPLYAEEYVRMLGDRGDSDLPLPETVQGIVAARLDLLGDDEKALLQDAAVLGKVFWTDALASLSGLETLELEERLLALERKEFVHRERRSAVAGEAQYAFRHVVVRDVAYGQMPRAARIDRHQRAAEWIESLAHDRAEDRSEMLAHHYLEALDLVRAAGGDVAPLAERARVSLRHAGDRAFGLNAFPAAAHFYETALELWPAESVERARLSFHAGRARFLEGDADARMLLGEASGALLACADFEAAAEAEMLLCEAIWRQGQRDPALEHLTRARALVEDLPVSRAKAYVLGSASRWLLLMNEFDETIRLGRKALAMAEELGLAELYAHALNNIGAARAASGDLQGIDDLQESIAIASESGSAYELVRGHINLGAALWWAGGIERSCEVFGEGVRLAEQFGQGMWLRWSQVSLVTDGYVRGDWDEALSFADRFLSEVEAGSPHYGASECYPIRAEIRLARGDQTGAVHDAERAVALAREAKDPQSLHPALAHAAHVLLESGKRDEAEVLVDQLLADLAGNAAMGGSLIALPALGLSLATLDRSTELLEVISPTVKSLWADAARAVAAGDLERAARIYAEMGARPDEAYVRLRAAEHLVAEGRRAEADRQLQLALTFYRSVGATRYIREGEALLAAAS